MPSRRLAIGGRRPRCGHAARATLGATLRAALVGLGAVVVAPAAFAGAPPVVFHSPSMDGTNPGSPYTLASPTETLDLWIEPGPARSDVAGGETVCLNGAGDEICGFTIELVTTGGLEMLNFADEPESDLVFNFVPPGSLRINRVAGTQPDEAPVRLGSLEVTVVGSAGGTLTLASTSEAVGADLGLVGVADADPIAAPEPAPLASIATGAAGLVALARRRQRRRAGGRRHVGQG